MKISPVAQGTAPVNPSEGNSASPDRLAKAKAIASGQDPATIPAPPQDTQVERVQNSIKRLKMKTQVSPDRHTRAEEAPLPEAVPPLVDAENAPTPTPDAVVTDSLAINEQTQGASEDKPLSPQFAALAKQKRALQLKEQELLAKEKALSTQIPDTKSLDEYRARIKANALSVLMEEGVTYDQLTEQILASNQENADLSALKIEIKALKEGFDNQTKSLSERDAAAEAQVLSQLTREANQLIAQGDDYEMVREAGYGSKVVELIHQVWKQQGELLDVAEAAALVEKELLEESLKFAKLKKVQSKLNPPAQAQSVQQDRPGTKTMRTLTNRDGVSSTTMSKRERAIAAMEGRLK